MRERVPRPGNLTFEEFLEIEARSDVRHEFVAGTLYAMAGATRRHNRIVASIVLAIGPVARSAGCDIFAAQCVAHGRIQGRLDADDLN